MTKKQLKQYRINKQIIAGLKREIATSMTHGVVKSATDFPYQNRPVIMQGLSVSDHNRIYAKQERIARLEDENRQIEQFVEGIKDNEIKRLLELYYIEGERKSWQQIAFIMGESDESYPRRKHNNYLKLAENAEFDMV